MSALAAARRVIDRRAFLAAVRNACALGALGCWLPACSPTDPEVVDERLRAALRAHLGGSRGARLIAAASGMTPDTALATLRSDASNLRLQAVASSELLLREFIESRSSADRRAGRTRRLQGWWIAETEVAVAVLSAG
jgi:hypothetical protein